MASELRRCFVARRSSEKSHVGMRSCKVYKLDLRKKHHNWFGVQVARLTWVLRRREFGQMRQEARKNVPEMLQKITEANDIPKKSSIL